MAGHPRRASILVGAVLVLAVQAARAEERVEARENRDPMADRSWRFIVGTPQVRLDAWPLGWGLRGEMGVEIRQHHLVMAQGSAHSLVGGGAGYLYQHTFVPRVVAIQAGAFTGFWSREAPCNDEHDGYCYDYGESHSAFFVPTVRVIAGYAYAFLTVGFDLYIGDTAIPSFTLGLEIKI